MNKCDLKLLNGHLQLVEMCSSGSGVFDNPVICDNGIAISVQKKPLIFGVNVLLRVKYLSAHLQA